MNRRIWKLHIPARPVVSLLAFFERMHISLPIKAEQILRLNENKNFSYEDCTDGFRVQPPGFRARNSDGIEDGPGIRRNFPVSFTIIPVTYIIAFLFLVILSYMGVFYFRRIAWKYQILDKPNERSSHFAPIPLGGGVVIVLLVLATGAWVANEIDWKRSRDLYHFRIHHGLDGLAG